MQVSTSQATLSGQLLELVNDIVWTVTRSGQLVYANPAIERVYGRPVTEFYHNPTLWLEMVHPADRELARGSAALVLAHGQTETTYRIIRPDGSIRWLLDRKHVLYNQAGQPEHIGGITTDITAQKEAEAELSHSQQLLAAFFCQALDGFFFMMLDEPVVWNDQVDQEAVLDYVFAHQRVTRVNQAILELYRTTKAEFISQTPQDFFAHDLAQGRAAWRRLLDQGRLHLQTEVRRFDGTPMYVEGDYVCLYDTAGRITGHFGIQRDITDRTHMAVKLQESEARFRLLLDSAPDAIFIAKMDTGIIIETNAAAVRLLDKPKPEIIGMHFSELHPLETRVESRADFATHISESDATGEGLPIEQVALRSDGERVPVEIAARVIELQGEKLLMGIFRDITDRKRIEAWLLASERKFRRFVEQSPDAIVLASETGQIIEWNGAAEQIFGQAREEVLGQMIWDVQFNFGLPELQTPARYKQLKAALQSLLKTGQGPLLNRLSEIGIQHPDGSQRVVQTIAFSIEHAAGFLLGSITRDVTEEKKIEAAVRESEERLDLVLKGADLGTWDWDIVTDRAIFNERWAEMLGYSLAELEPTASTWQRLMHPDDGTRVMAALTAHLAGQTPIYQAEHRLRTKSGDWKWILDTGKVFERDEADRPLRAAGTHLDITARKAAEAERERLIAELQATLAQVKQLSGLLPICASCKKIRDDAGYWQDVAVYIRDHSEAEFSHGFCPECMEKLYPEFYKRL